MFQWCCVVISHWDINVRENRMDSQEREINVRENRMDSQEWEIQGHG
jgi:hypothetical protein